MKKAYIYVLAVVIIGFSCNSQDKLKNELTYNAKEGFTDAINFMKSTKDTSENFIIKSFEITELQTISNKEKLRENIENLKKAQKSLDSLLKICKTENKEFFINYFSEKIKRTNHQIDSLGLELINPTSDEVFYRAKGKMRVSVTEDSKTIDTTFSFEPIYWDSKKHVIIDLKNMF